MSTAILTFFELLNMQHLLILLKLHKFDNLTYLLYQLLSKVVNPHKPGISETLAKH